MDDEDYRPHGDVPPSPELTELRLLAEQLARDEADTQLLALVPRLRADTQWWPHLWAPAAAIAAHRHGGADALGLLVEAVDRGFSQPELHAPDLEEHFGDTPQWPKLLRRMEGNVPLPPLVLHEWPDPGIQAPMTPYAIAADRADALRERLPSPSPSAWQTAKELTRWVRQQWAHANDHVDDPDALEVLQRVEAGERFACVEYSIVLTQALNACGIPARRVELLQRHHHTGVGRGHVVSEAWVDDLDAWVVLDGQNAAWWAGADDRPLGVRELQRGIGTDAAPPRMVGLDEECTEREATSWLTYFAGAATTGYAWAAPGFSPIFQGVGVISTARLLRDGDLAYPDLSAVSVGLGGSTLRPTLRLHTSHPWATGLVVAHDGARDDVTLQSPVWPLALEPGRHAASIAVTTAYGECRSRPLVYEVR